MRRIVHRRCGSIAGLVGFWLALVTGVLASFSPLALGATQSPADVSPERLLALKSFRNQNLERYPELDSVLVDSWLIPGLAANFVPQGLAPIPGTSHVLISGYLGEAFSRHWFFNRLRTRATRKRSVIYLIDHPSGRPIRVALLEESGGKPMRRHAGGVAVTGAYFWIPSHLSLYRFDLRSLLESNADVVTLRPNAKPVAVDSHGSVLSAWGDYLLVGDFVRSARESPNHRRGPGSTQAAWTAGYHIDPANGWPSATATYPVKTGNQTKSVLRPDFVIHHGRLVQGITVLGDGWLALSHSYGDRDSAVSLHQVGSRIAAGEAPQTTTLPGGSTVPSWTLGTDTLVQTIDAPPGSEGIAWLETGDVLGVAFEGGAYPYRKRWCRLEDRTLFIDVSGIIEKVETGD